MIRVLIADDHFIVREGFRQVLSKRMDIKIVGEATNCRIASSSKYVNPFSIKFGLNRPRIAKPKSMTN